MEARNSRPDRREIGTQIGLIGKTENRIGYQIRRPVSVLAKTENQMLKNGKSASRNEHQNRKSDQKIAITENRKSQCPSLSVAAKQLKAGCGFNAIEIYSVPTGEQRVMTWE